MDQAERQKLEEITEMTTTLGWRYFTEELLEQRQQVLEAFMQAENEQAMGVLQGRILQINEIMHLSDIASNLLNEADNDADV